jgi:hypothetical protein
MLPLGDVGCDRFVFPACWCSISALEFYDAVTVPNAIIELHLADSMPKNTEKTWVVCNGFPRDTAFSRFGIPYAVLGAEI